MHFLDELRRRRGEGPLLFCSLSHGSSPKSLSVIACKMRPAVSTAKRVEPGLTGMMS